MIMRGLYHFQTFRMRDEGEGGRRKKVHHLSRQTRDGAAAVGAESNLWSGKELRESFMRYSERFSHFPQGKRVKSVKVP